MNRQVATAGPHPSRGPWVLAVWSFLFLAQYLPSHSLQEDGDCASLGIRTAHLDLYFCTGVVTRRCRLNPRPPVTRPGAKGEVVFRDRPRGNLHPFFVRWQQPPHRRDPVSVRCCQLNQIRSSHRHRWRTPHRMAASVRRWQLNQIAKRLEHDSNTRCGNTRCKNRNNT